MDSLETLLARVGGVDQHHGTTSHVLPNLWLDFRQFINTNNTCPPSSQHECGEWLLHNNVTSLASMDYVIRRAHIPSSWDGLLFIGNQLPATPYTWS
jgi:hypothetical protein